MMAAHEGFQNSGVHQWIGPEICEENVPLLASRLMEIECSGHTGASYHPRYTLFKSGQ
jgi:hypothetical protein